MKLLLIAGHGGTDPGAVGNGMKESDLARELSDLVYAKMVANNIDVEQYPKEQNCYQDSRNGNPPQWSKYDHVIELHFNAFNGTAGGNEVLIHTGTKDAEKAETIANGMMRLGFMYRGVKERSDLLNMNLCYKAGVPYMLIETCFIDNKNDMERYTTMKDNVAHLIATTFVSTKSAQTPTLYRVQVGAFSFRDNAEKLVAELKSKGYDAYIKEETV